MRTISVSSRSREEMIEITRNVESHVFTQHTTCGLTINENADPDVKSDMLDLLKRLIPQYEPNFKHFEHNSHAHIKSSLVGSSVLVPYNDGKLLLGRWQGIYLCEFDGPRDRSVLITTL